MRGSIQFAKIWPIWINFYCNSTAVSLSKSDNAVLRPQIWHKVAPLKDIHALELIERAIKGLVGKPLPLTRYSSLIQIFR